MPLYDFKCISCDHIFEVVQKYSDDAPFCETCNKKTKKIISSTTFILKGDGWYKDGYCSKSPKPKKVLKK
jgi:putative FmdB family regulatory protein